MALTQVDQGLLSSTAQYTGFKNRIINGAMVIDQRNAGAQVTPSGDPVYTLDRWYITQSQNSKFNIQQNGGSVTPPAGFSKYLGATVASAVTVGASDYFALAQGIEGFNISDFSWGTSSAATVTLSFWVRSSLTGTFGGALRNTTGNLSYPFTYTISSANTWEQKSVTITGPTSGTWNSNSSEGVTLRFGMGVGSTYNGTAGAWATGNYFSATGATSVVGTSGATFYITGVQLEKGSTATSFDYRPYGTELSLCQRYYQTYAQPSLHGITNSTSTAARLGMCLPVVMRSGPTASFSGSLVGYDGSVTQNVTSVGASYLTAQSIEFDLGFASTTFTAYRPCSIIQSGTGSIGLSAEL